MSNDVYVVAEHLKGQLADITFELLGKGKTLAGSLGGELVCLLAGHNCKGLADQLGAANKVIHIDHEQLAEFNPEAYAKALAAVLGEKQPKMVLVGNTSMGMDLAAGLSIDLDVPLVAYGTQISADSGKVTVTSSLYGGKVNVESNVTADRCIVSTIAGSFPVEDGKADGAPAIEDAAAPDLSGLRLKFKQLIEPEAGDVDITQHDILVSVGRGIQSDENLPMMQELSDKLGGALSSSRPIVDNKWLPKARQVGKSGLKVKPKLYLAIGISGAPEHIEGMKDSELIIAINSDPKAPIFDYAHYGVTTDLFDIVPALTGKL